MLEDVRNDDGRRFICGVVEGFYGRPWTLEQRRHLLAKMRTLGMNTYLYAPKDDAKHRANWRILYTEQEAEHLGQLISAAAENGVTFVYALSPGIDICYSNPKEVRAVIDKLEQVRSLGCSAFALLFDDIEPSMSTPDRARFRSFAHAQVEVSNQVHELMGVRDFYFCPTEYCESRAAPSLDESDYLSTVGQSLHSGIEIMWTGPRVVSRRLSPEHCHRVGEVMKRRPLIWDNLHANDYDPKRVFLGPFMGRPVSLRSEVSGVLLNPNCKYEANFIPFQTLADWNRSDADANVNEESMALLEAGSSSPVAAKVVESGRPLTLFHPLDSLHNAVRLWTEQFHGGGKGPAIPPIRDVADIADEEETPRTEALTLDEIIIQGASEEPATMTTCNPVNSLSADYGEPMELASRSASVDMAEQETITESDRALVALLVDAFFLPFECGRRVAELFEEFSWCRENAGVMREHDSASRVEWQTRHEQLQTRLRDFKRLFEMTANSNNKSLVSELIPYVWELHGVACVVSAVAAWMAQGHVSSVECERHWIRLGESEPWSMGGGFVADSIRLFTDSPIVTALFTNKAALPLSICAFWIRPVAENDKRELCRLIPTCVSDDSVDETYEKLFSLYLPSCSYAFLAEEPSSSTVLCALSAITDTAEWQAALPARIRSLEEFSSESSDDSLSWLPQLVTQEMIDKYPTRLQIWSQGDSLDAVPTKRLVHTVAATLSMQGIRGAHTLVHQEHTQKLQLLTKLGFEEIGSIDDTVILTLSLVKDDME